MTSDPLYPVTTEEAETMTEAQTHTLTENTACGECGMRVEPADAFHPYLYCWLFKAGASQPGAFLAEHGFIPDPRVWGERSD